MDKDYLTLTHASASRPSGEWGDDDYDVLADGVVVGRIMRVSASLRKRPFGHHHAIGREEAAETSNVR
jgi:hypothetical protein